MDERKGTFGFFRPETDLGRRAAETGGAGGWRARAHALLYPPLPDIARRNETAFLALFAAAPVLGSLFTFALVLLAGWALISALLGRIPWRLGRPDLPIVLASLLFILVLGGIDLALNGRGGVSQALALLIYLVPALQISRMRVTPPAEVLPRAFLGLSIGGLLIGVLALWQVHAGLERAQGLAGNAGPFSVAALVALGGSALAFSGQGSRRRNLLAAAGTFGALAALLLSGMRGSWPAAPLILLACAWARAPDLRARWRQLSPRRRLALPLVLAGLAALLVALVLPAVTARVGMFDADLRLLVADSTRETSLSLRWAMYQAGLAAFAEAPVLGHGLSRIWAAVTPHFAVASVAGTGFTHLHNTFLTMAVAGGIAGVLAVTALLLAPLATAILWRRADGGAQARERIAFALVLLLAFLVPGLSNVSITHDVPDGIWVFAAPALAASVPFAARPSFARRRRETRA